jgi:hypothetical protein
MEDINFCKGGYHTAEQIIGARPGSIVKNR